MRLFIGIKIPDIPELSRLKKEVNSVDKISDISWVPPQNRHITLLYLGYTDESDQYLVQNCLRDISSKKSSFELRLKGINQFQKRRQKTVLWLAVEFCQTLMDLQEAIAKDLKECLQAHKFDEMPFIPHVTVARFSQRNKIQESFFQNYSETAWLQLSVNEFILYESKSSDHGLEYLPLEKYPFTIEKSL